MKNAFFSKSSHLSKEFKEQERTRALLSLSVVIWAGYGRLVMVACLHKTTGIHGVVKHDLLIHSFFDTFYVSIFFLFYKGKLC